MIVRISEEAERDLEDIADYIAKDNPARAMTFVQELRAAALSLGDFPNRYPLLAKYEHQGVRKCPYEKYLIFYTIEADQIAIAHILNSTQDYETILFPDS